MAWTEINVWEYIRRESIPVIPLYFDRGAGTRYRSLGCAPCTNSISSTATTVDEIIEELRTSKVAQRSGVECIYGHFLPLEYLALSMRMDLKLLPGCVILVKDLPRTTGSGKKPMIGQPLRLYKEERSKRTGRLNVFVLVPS